MENNLTENVKSLFEKTSDYVETRTELYKLKAVEKTSEALSSAFATFIVIVICLIFLSMLNIAIAFLLGDLLGKIYYGFFMLAGFYLIVGITCYYNRRKWFKESLADMIIQKFLK